jgi:hypothetical protein
VIAHGFVAQKRQGGKWTDDGIFHAKEKIGHEKNNGYHDGRCHSFFRSYF